MNNFLNIKYQLEQNIEWAEYQNKLFQSKRDIYLIGQTNIDGPTYRRITYSMGDKYWERFNSPECRQLGDSIIKYSEIKIRSIKKLKKVIYSIDSLSKLK